MKSCVFTSDPPLGLGSTYDQEAAFLGKKILTSFEVVGFEPGRLVKISSTSGSFPITVTRTVEPDGDNRCRVAAIVEGEADGFFKIAAPLMRIMVERSGRQDYARLKTLLEAGESAHGT